MKPISLALAAAFGLATMAQPGAAQDAVHLKLAHGYPATHFLWEHGVARFVDRVAEQTGGKVTFEVFPNSQLGKDQLALLSSGLADVALLTPAIAGGKLPLTSVTELPGLFGTSCEATRKFSEIAKEGGPLNEAEYKPLKLHVLYVLTVPPYTVITTKKPVASLADMSGLKIRVAGNAMTKTVGALGGVPVQIPGPEMFDALTRGTVDGALYSHMALPSLKLDQLFKYSVGGMSLGGGSVVLAMSDRAWEALPEDVKVAMNEAGPITEIESCSWQDEQEASFSKELAEERDWQIATLYPEEKAQWEARITEVAKDWAAEMESTGKPGDAILEAFRNAKGTE